jgi:polyisoprenoid-binding protein YceI
MTMKKMLMCALALCLTAAPAAEQAAAPVDPTVWTIDTNNSAAGFAVKHMLISTVRGTAGPVSGRIWWDGKNVAGIRADITIDVTKVNTANDGRDRHLKTDDFFNVEKFPTMKFVSKRVIAGTAGTFKLVGDLTIRDVTKEVTLDVEGPSQIIVDRGVSRTAAVATTTVNRFDYGLKWNNLIEAGGAVVGPDVKVTIELQATKR